MLVTLEPYSFPKGLLPGGTYNRAIEVSYQAPYFNLGVNLAVLGVNFGVVFWYKGRFFG